MDSSKPTEVVAFCRAGNHEGKGANVLLACGAVEWMDRAALTQAVTTTLQNLKISIELPEDKPAADKPDDTALEKAIADLASDEFNIRAAAKETLEKAGEPARKLLESATQASDPEQVGAAKNLLKGFDERKAYLASRRAWVEALRKELDLDTRKPDDKK